MKLAVESQVAMMTLASVFKAREQHLDKHIEDAHQIMDDLGDELIRERARADNLQREVDIALEVGTDNQQVQNEAAGREQRRLRERVEQLERRLAQQNCLSENASDCSCKRRMRKAHWLS